MRVNEGIDDSLIRFPNYSHFRCDRRVRRGGGVCVWVHSSLSVVRLSASNQPDYLEAVWLCLPKIKVLFTCVYLPPDSVTLARNRSGIDDYIISNFDVFLAKYCDFDIIMCGDLNRYDVQSISAHLDLLNLVTEPTRSNVILDYFLVSSAKSHAYNVTVAAPISNSDHATINAEPKAPLKFTNAITKPLYDLRQSNIDKFYGELSIINWTNFYLWNANVNEKCALFQEILHQHMERCIPMRLVEMTESDKPWMTPLVKISIQNRWDAFRRRDFSAYNHWKAKTKKMIIDAKRAWSSKSRTNCRNLWKVVNSVTGSKSNDSLYPLINQFDSTDAAVNAINEIFSCVC